RLLLLASHGAFVARVTHPRYGVVKEYDVLLDRPISPRDQARLLSGVEIEGGLARALSVSPFGTPQTERPAGGRPQGKPTGRRPASRRAPSRRSSPASAGGIQAALRPPPFAANVEPRYSVELAEGKKREVRLMMRAVGRRVLRLSRVRVGGLRLGRLPTGSVRELSAREARKASHG
ncbi:MAG: hypothetical protein OXE50_02980, partial [Chloroflexi bacterium]|nr:hypothetical protein [Chloroflexota bacterium]